MPQANSGDRSRRGRHAAVPSRRGNTGGTRDNVTAPRQPERLGRESASELTGAPQRVHS